MKENRRPGIYYVNCTLLYYKKKDRSKYKNAKTQKQKDRFVKRFYAKEMIFTLDDNYKHISTDMHLKDARRIWIKYNIAGKHEDHYYKIVDIEIMQRLGTIIYNIN
jgi:hypothetical protein